MSPLRQNNLVSMYSSVALSKDSYSVISAFCTENNIPQCISYINQVLQNFVYYCSAWFVLEITQWPKMTMTCVLFYSQELASLGLSSTCIEASSPGGASLNTVPALNAMYELLQIHRRNMCTLEELEKEQLKKSSTLEHMQMSNSRLKACMVGVLGLLLSAVLTQDIVLFISL